MVNSSAAGGTNPIPRCAVINWHEPGYFPASIPPLQPTDMFQKRVSVMAITRNLIIMLAAVMVLMANAASERELGTLTLASISIASEPGVNIAGCGNALTELRMCMNEFIGFFLNAVTEIDAPCCTAIEVVMHHCMPDMLGSLGFTMEQGRLLQGYCDNTSATPAPAPPANIRHA